MIDICFNDSFSGLLKIALISDCVFFLFNYLNYGNLDCDDLMVQQTRSEAESLKHFYKDFPEKEIEDAYEESIKWWKIKFEKLERLLNDGHKIRIWVSNTARDRCGLFWFCNFIKNYSNEILIIECPGFEYDNRTDRLVERHDWASFSNPYFINDFSDTGRTVCDDERSLYSEKWDQLIEENAPLRILINDVIVGVREDFFDNIILNFIDTEPKSQRIIMREMLSKWHSCDTNFLSQRIDYLIESNKIKVHDDIVDDYNCFWGRTLVRL